MIVETPDVKIGGRKIPVYSVDYQNGGADSPSSLTLKYVNKNGQYDWPDLSSQSLVRIKIGSFFSFNGYAVTADKDTTEGGVLLSVKYLDESIVLDSCFVGLKGVHGEGFGTKVVGSNFAFKTILLGEQVDPCKDLDEVHEDPCAPTSDTGDSAPQENQQKQIDCAESRLIKILDVVYSFSDLIKGIGKFGIHLRNIPMEKLSYFGRHTGSLREVLNAWCQEYGITYFWENGINFVDLKNGIDINDTINGSVCRILDKKESKSIEGNTSIAGINYFGLDGFINKYTSNLNGGLRLTLMPITLSDLFIEKESGKLNSFIKKYYGNLEIFQRCCMLSKYSPNFRDLYLQKNKYAFVNADPEEAKEMPLLGITTLLNFRPDTYEQDANFLKSISPEIASEVMGDKSKLFAVKCYYSQENHNKFIELERYISNEVMGRYWVRHFNKRGYSFSAPGGSAEFIPDPNAGNFEFSKYIPKSVLKINRFLRELFDVSQTDRENTDFYSGGIVLVQRSSPWQPEDRDLPFFNSNELLNTLHFNYINDTLPEVPTAEEGGAWDGARYSFAKDGDKQPIIKIFGRLEDVVLEVREAGFGDHPLEGDNVNIHSVVGNFSTVYGLNSSICKAYEITIQKSKMFIYTPVQSYDNFGSDFPGFTVVAEKNGSLEYKILVNKVQRVMLDYVKNQANLKNCTSLSVNFRDATQYINKILKKNANTCEYDIEQIELLLRDFTSNFSSASPVVRQSVAYTLGGLPPSVINLTDGLSSFSITLSADGGMITQLQYSNIPKITYSDNIRLKDYERRNIINYNKSFFSSDNKEILQ